MDRILNAGSRVMVVLLLLQLCVGLLLSLVYVPSVADFGGGKFYRAYTTAQVVFVNTPLGTDTVQVRNGVALIRCDTGIPKPPDLRASSPVQVVGKPLTEVEKSLTVDLPALPFGAEIRTLHRAVADALWAVMLGLFFLGALLEEYIRKPRWWYGLLFLIFFVGVANWLGLMLPFNDYAHQSRAGITMAMQSDLPFGAVIAQVTGILSQPASVLRLYVLHVLVVPAIIAGLVILWRGGKNSWSLETLWVSVGLTALGFALQPFLSSLVPVWHIKPAEGLAATIGYELAGIVVVFLFGLMCAMPLVSGRTSKGARRTGFIILAILYVGGLFL